jgi:hypothetical protein
MIDNEAIYYFALETLFQWKKVSLRDIGSFCVEEHRIWDVNGKLYYNKNYYLKCHDRQNNVLLVAKIEPHCISASYLANKGVRRTDRSMVNTAFTYLFVIASILVLLGFLFHHAK